MVGGRCLYTMKYEVAGVVYSVTTRINPMPYEGHMVPKRIGDLKSRGNIDDVANGNARLPSSSRVSPGNHCTISQKFSHEVIEHPLVLRQVALSGYCLSFATLQIELKLNSST